MSSMVNDFIIGPALRQVRRFSFSSLSSEPEPRTSPNPIRKETGRPSSREDVISETEEDSYFKNDGDDSASQPPSSRSSLTPIMDSEALDSIRYRRQPGSTISHNVASDSLQAIAAMGSQQNISPPNAESSDPGHSSALRASMPESEEVTTVASVVPNPRKALPEDDGMGALRKRILEIQSKNIPAPERARLMHALLIEGYTKSQIVIQATRPLTPSSGVSWEQAQSPQGVLDSFKFWQGNLGETRTTEKFTLTDADVKIMFAPLREGEADGQYRALGCEHYKRNVKSQCSTCNRWYVCRFCHDKVEDHAMVAKDTKNMLCMFCKTAQKAGEVCIVCAESAALYYCSTCKLWNNDPDKSIYHCGDCGICRIGRGLGKDFFHCKKCCACLAINLENDHRCIERSLDCDCPICSDYMFSSPKPVCFMRCGHAMHRGCYEEHIKSAYKCPICSKSVVNMETQFRNLDIAIQMQPMPEKFKDTRAVVLCNDCSAKTTTEYHWLGLKCAVCRSYNTSELQILGVDSGQGLTGVSGANTTTPQSSEPQNEDPSTSASQNLAPRDIPRRRRHSSNVLDHGMDTSSVIPLDLGSFVLQERLVRSVSPSHAAERTMRSGIQHSSADDSDDEAGDFIGFWSRVPQSIKSNDEDGESESDGESLSSADEDMEDDDDEDDEEEISLFGHR